MPCCCFCQYIEGGIAVYVSDVNIFPQACYGVLKIPEGEWFCDRCAVRAKEEPCVLCPVYEGAMKRTEQGKWCHCSCVWWIPEVHFKDTIAMRPVMGVPNVPRSRFSLKCIFCETNNGACHSTCAPFLHSTSGSRSSDWQEHVFSARTRNAEILFMLPVHSPPRRFDYRAPPTAFASTLLVRICDHSFLLRTASLHSFIGL